VSSEAECPVVGRGKELVYMAIESADIDSGFRKRHRCCASQGGKAYDSVCPLMLLRIAF
jgi:hypothetical protein